MPEYLSPGVYVEEIDAGPKPIEGVSTSTAGAVGVTACGPDTGKPVLITSFADYVRVFGGAVDVDGATKAKWSDDPERGEFWTFPLAVKGFFDNGGQRIYVRRVTAKTATASSATMGKGVVAQVVGNAAAGSSVLQLSSLIGISAGSVLSLVVDGVAAGVTVQSYDSAARTIKLTAALAKDVKAGRDFAVVKTAAAGTIKLAADSSGAWGDAISVRAYPMEAATFPLLADPAVLINDVNSLVAADVNPASQAFGVTAGDGAKFRAGDAILVNGAPFTIATVAGDTLTVNQPAQLWTKDWTVVRVKTNGAVTSAVAADVAAPAQSFALKAGDGAKFAVGDHILVDGKPFSVSAIAGDAVTVNEPAQLWQKDWSVIRVRYAARAAGNRLFVWGASSLYKNALVEIENTATSARRYDLVTDITGNAVTFANNLSENLWEGQRIRLIEAHFSIRYSPASGPEVTEEIGNVRLKESEPGDPMHIATRLSASSRFVSVVTPPAIDIGTLDDFPLAVDASNDAAPWMALSGGNDDYGALDVDAFIGQDLGPGKRSGIQALEDIDDISLCMAPSIWSSLVQNALIQHCETLKYRFAILDPRPVDPNAVDAIGDVQAFRAGFDTKYAALYFPRIEVRDPFLSTTIGLGPSGHMAGLYARVDVERGVHKAPANEVLRGIDTSNGFHGLEDEITKREQDMLNPKGINALRFFPDRGTRVWGARTLSSDGSWKYVNVRRIFIWVERSIDVGTQWVVFEPNDEKTWARVRQTITNFLTTVWRSGALFGSKADEAFFVRCDRTTMTQDDIDNGRLIVAIGIAPVKPAEFVIFRIQQKLIDQTQP